MMTVLVVACVFVCTPIASVAAEMLQPGDPFPAWTLTDHTGAVVSSKDLTGRRYLLWYYPKAMTPGCTAEGNALRDNFPQFQTQAVEILGVSFDSVADNAAFVNEQGFPFRLLSDPDRKLAVAVGAASSTNQAVARRISYLVGPDAKVIKAYPSVNPATHAQDVLADLRAADGPGL
jgi:peroxiredoxin Q/BCP